MTSYNPEGEKKVSTDIACDYIWKQFHDTKIIWLKLGQTSYCLDYIQNFHQSLSREVKKNSVLIVTVVIVVCVLIKNNLICTEIYHRMLEEQNRHMFSNIVLYLIWDYDDIFSIV